MTSRPHICCRKGCCSPGSSITDPSCAKRSTSGETTASNGSNSSRQRQSSRRCKRTSRRTGAWRRRRLSMVWRESPPPGDNWERLISSEQMRSPRSQRLDMMRRRRSASGWSAWRRSEYVRASIPTVTRLASGPTPKKDVLNYMPASNNLKNVLAQRPLGLVFDIDGTLSPIAPTSDEARLYSGVVPLLQRVRERAHVAIMTGREIEDGARLVNVEGLTYIGTHGLEWSDGLPSLHTVQVVPGAWQYIEPGTYLLDLVEQQLPRLPGVYVQRKRVGGTLHYRLSADQEQARRDILAILGEPAREVNMRLREGQEMVWVFAPLAGNYGVAVLG